MANELIKMKSGLIKNIEKNKTTGRSPVDIEAGTIYFAVDDNKETGKILYDVDSTHRVVMGTQAEYADYAGEAAKATGITGIYPVKGKQTAVTNIWTGTIEGVNELFDGLTIAYYLPYNGTSTAATLNLTFEDGTTTGPVDVYYGNNTRMTTHISAGSTIILTYWSAGSIKIAGTATENARWTRSDYDSTIIYQLRNNYGNYTTLTALYRYQILLTKDEDTLLPVNSVNNNLTSTKTLTSEAFDPFGAIYYYSSTSTVAANNVISAGALFRQALVDLRYSFNTGTTLSGRKAVYIVAIPQSNGLAKLDSNPITQDLPTTQDGKIYIYLGQTYYENSGNCYRVELTPTHPIYYYKGDKIALYTGEPLASATNSGLMSTNDKIIIDQLTVYSIEGTSPINASTKNGVASISHATSGVNANTYGTTATTALNPAFGDTFSVPGFTVNNTGHVTAAGAHNVKIPATLASATTNGLMSKGDKGKFDSGITIANNTIEIGSSLSADTLRTSLGLSNAMHFIGHATVAIEDTSTTDPQILNYDFGVNGANAKPGDVIIDKEGAYEYVWSTLGRWERLGADSYGLSISGHTVSIVPGGSTLSVSIPDNNTWNKVSTAQDGYISKLSGNANQYLNGNGQWTTPPNDNDNTTYGLSISGHTVSLVEGGTTTSVTIPDNNTWQVNSSSQNGYVISGSGQANKVWKTDADGNPAWRDDANNTYSLATNTNLGLVKPWYNHTAASTGPTAGSNNTAVAVNTISTTANRYYAIESDSNGRLFVNVPWTDNNTWNANTATQAGYVASPNSAANKVWKTDANGAPAWRDDTDTTYSTATSSALGLVKLGSDTKQTAAMQAVTATANRTYAVQLNSSNQMVVNVPWTDNNTDTKVSQALASDNVNYPVIFGNTAITSTTATLTEATKRNNSVFVNPSTKRLTANQIGVTESVHMEYNSTTKSLDFIFD